MRRAHPNRPHRATAPTAPPRPSTPAAPEDRAETAANHVPETSSSPTARQWWARARGPLLALAVLLVAGITLAALRSGEQHGRLDPRSADRYGSRAVAELLAERGVTTRVVTGTDEAIAAAGPGTTLLVTEPDLLTARQRTALRDSADVTPRRTVLVAPENSPGALAPGTRAAEPTLVEPRAPDCGFAPAERAGDAETGGLRYTFSASGADACYLSDGLPTLLRVPGPHTGDTVLLGSPDILYNSRLAERGNASLTLQLLGSEPHLVWYLPSLGDTAANDGGDRTFFDLVPAGWRWAALQLAVAAALAALWRARRLGPLVTERLPVAVRASEATEGRARLYQRANARGQAAETLRSATRTRLAPLVGVPAAQSHAPEALCPALAARAPSSAPAPWTLLFGPGPEDDTALIRLADDLDTLERHITSGLVSPPPPHSTSSTSTERDSTS